MSSVAKRFIPLLDRVLVQKVKPSTTTAGGILLPEQTKSSINKAMVIAVGPGKFLKSGERQALSVAVGDAVVVPEYGGALLKFDGDEYQIFRDEDILGVLRE